MSTTAPLPFSLSRRQFLLATAGVTALGVTPLWRPALAAQDIRLGALGELSGQASTIGSQQALGIQFAVDEIHKTGGIHGKWPAIDGSPIILHVADTETKAPT